MTLEDRHSLRCVVDPNVYVSAAISGRGAPAQLLAAAIAGRLTLIVSPLLLSELRDVLKREKFRPYLGSDESEEFIQALLLVAEAAQDPPSSGRVNICRDPNDDYLVWLTQDSEANLLVSGDGDLLSLKHPGLDVRTVRDTVELLEYRHPWGTSLIPAESDAAWRQAAGEGHDNVLAAASAFLVGVNEPDVGELLQFVVTPESLPLWLSQLPLVRAMVAGRGMATRPEYPSPGIAYVKLPLDPGQTIKATAEVALPEAIILTLQRRPELVDAVALGGWRVHAVGEPIPAEDMPGAAVPK